MRSIGIASALLVTVLLLVVVWLVARALGFEVSLLGSLGLTLALTVILNLILGAWSRHKRRW